MLDDGYPRARKALLITILAAYAAAAVALASSKVEFDFGSCGMLAAAVGIIAAEAVYARRRGMPRLAAALEVLFAGLVLIPPVVVGSYVAIALDAPLADAALARADAALGFDWLGFLALVDRSAVLSALLGAAYSSFFPQLLFLPAYMAAAGDGARACAAIIAFVATTAAACVISAWWPSIGAYAHYGVAADAVGNVNAFFGYAFLEDFHALRAQTSFVLRLDDSSGLLTFPSVHAGVAAICAWLAWDSRRLRYPFLALNVAMAVSAIPIGAHYAVDVIAGVAVAALAVCGARAAVGMRAPAPAPAREPFAAA